MEFAGTVFAALAGRVARDNRGVRRSLAPRLLQLAGRQHRKRRRRGGGRGVVVVATFS